MYTEEPKREINWSNVLKKGLIVLLVAVVIFFIIWLLTRSNNNVNVDYDKNNPNNSSSAPNSNVYSKEYLEGYRYFHDTAKEYFLISELPTPGKTLKYTLQELIDKGLLFPWEYKNGNSCDTEASYVSVTNVGGKYKYTVTLVCGTEVSKTTEDLGCNQLCQNNNCGTTPTPTEDEITEYRFRQPYTATETVYTCPTGYTRNGTVCIKNTSNTVEPTKNTTYKCPSGYTASGSGANMICTKIVNDEIDATRDTIYYCPSGYTASGSGANTRCYKPGSESTPANYTYTYSCAYGYEQIGSGANTKCIKSSTSTTSPVASTTYSCPSGYTPSGSGSNLKCTKTETTKAVANSSKTCPSGYTLSGSTCVSKTASSPNVTSTYTCPTGTKNSDGKTCRIYSSKEYYESYEIYHGETYNGCSYSGSYTDVCTDKSNCTRTYYKYKCSTSSYKDVDALETKSYSCPSGYTSSGSGSSMKCYKNTTPTTSTTYSCPASYTASGSGSSMKCTKAVDGTPISSTTYSCPTGYTSVGSGSNMSCVITDSIEGNVYKDKEYYCSNSNDTLVGDRCYRDTIDEVSASSKTDYTCPKGYSLNGTKCSASSNATTKAIKNTNYSCPSGYTKEGIGGNAICTKGTVVSVDATKSTKNVTKYQYQWSTETSIPGWERTGETRKTKAK